MRYFPSLHRTVDPLIPFLVNLWQTFTLNDVSGSWT